MLDAISKNNTINKQRYYDNNIKKQRMYIITKVLTGLLYNKSIDLTEQKTVHILPREQEPREEFSPLSVMNDTSPPAILPGFCSHNYCKMTLAITCFLSLVQLTKFLPK